MYSKKEAAKLKAEFWTVFGQYLAPVLSAGGEHVNWINYKTGEKNIYFRMNAGNKTAAVSIEITHKDEGLQALYFEQFKQLKILLTGLLKEDWTWLLHAHDANGNMVSRIYNSIENVNVFDKADWPKIISFFKPRIIALDEFWSNAKDVFETMR